MKARLFFYSALLFLVSMQTSMAQEDSKKSLILLSTGYASFNNGDEAGIAISNDYVRNINRHFTYGAKYIFAHGQGNVKGMDPVQNTHISTTALDLNGYYNPFTSGKHILLVGLGISIDFTRTTLLSDSDYVLSNGKTYTLANTESTISLLEPVFNLHYYYNFNKCFLGCNVNTRDWQFYQYIVGIGGGIKF